MITYVVDASSVVEYLLDSPLGGQVAARLMGAARFVVPDICPIEVTHALRGLNRGGKLTAVDGARAVTSLLTFPAPREKVEPLLGRAWQLRDNLTAYDATYVVLAEALQARLLTCDAKFDTPVVTRLIDVEVVTRPAQ